MNFVDNTSLNIVKEYIQNYKSSIEKKHPELSKQTIEIETDNENVLPKTEPMVTVIPEEIDSIHCVRILVNINYSGVTGNLNNRFNKEELFALLSHEIGHVVARINGKASSDNAEEVYADNCAFELGLGAPMIEAIKKMKEDYNYSPNSYFNSLPGLNNYSTGEMDKRIVELEKLTTITDATM